MPGTVCPFCGTDCAPVAGPNCAHWFLTDGENGWRFSAAGRRAYAATGDDVGFRDRLYHDPLCREDLVLRRAVYDDALEIYVFSRDPERSVRAFGG